MFLIVGHRYTFKVLNVNQILYSNNTPYTLNSFNSKKLLRDHVKSAGPYNISKRISLQTLTSESLFFVSQLSTKKGNFFTSHGRY